ncbi:MAG TPA: TonB-dependent receptor [Planctomycetota bacterium]|nr:TonB-dependent receptor [Planctomycetota bacterium]
MRVAFALTIALSLAATFCAHSGEDKPTLPEVVVTAKAPKPEPPPAPPEPPKVQNDYANAPTRQTPGGADIVKVQKFIEGRTGAAVDLFEGTPGVFIQSENGAQDTRFSIRGSGIESEGTGIQFFVDGIPINEGDGQVILSDVDLLAVSGAEVYRGSNALRYGALGLGGAVNFRARTGYDSCGFGTRFEAGSFGYFSESASYGDVIGNTDYFIASQDLQSDGYRKHSAEDNQKFFGDVGMKLGCNIDNRVYVSVGRLNREDPGGLTREELRSTPTHANDDAIAMDFHKQWETARLADKITMKFDEDQTFSAAAFYQYRIQTDKQFFDVDDPQGIVRFHSHDVGLTFNYDNVRELACYQNRLTLGFTPTIEYESDVSYENDGGAQGPQTDGDRTFAANAVLYGEDQFHITDKLSAIGGLQLINSRRHFMDQFSPSGIANRSRVQDFYGVNPKIGLLYDLNDSDQIFGNFARSFQPPSFDDLTAVRSSAGSLYHTLRAQTGSTVEVGSRGQRGRVEWEISAYHTWLEHELLSLANARGETIGAVNARSTIHQGVETELDTELWRGIAARCCNCDHDRILLRQTYTLNDFHFQNDKFFGDNRIASIPIHLYMARLEYQHPLGFYAGPSMEWNITRYPVDHANTLFAEQYTLLNFRTGYKSPHGFTLFFEAKNLTNKTYAATVEPQADARVGGPPDAFKPGNGRAFYGGFSFKW